MVRLERSTYGVSESGGRVEVCARVESPSGSCPIRIPFSLRISTRDNTAGSIVASHTDISGAVLRQFGCGI